MEKTAEKEQLSAKKNSESNIINQFYSFLTHRHNSEKLLRWCLKKMGKSEEDIDFILPIFYQAIRLINIRRGRKYVNVSMLRKLFTPDRLDDCLDELKQQISTLPCLDISEFC